MEKYIGVKEIDAEKKIKDNKEGYKVVYENPDGSKYETWSPKDVFELAYRKINDDKKMTREKLCDIFSQSNNLFGQFMPQQYVSIFLDLCEKNNITFKK